MQPQSKSLNEVAKELYLAIAFLKECNYKCGYCHPFGESKITQGENLTKKELEKVLDTAVDSGFETFRFTGGECTLLPWFPDTLEYALSKNENVRVNICTNGSRLDKHMDLFEKHKDRVQLRISLDSTREKQRVEGFYKILTPSLESSLYEVSKREIPARFNTVVTQKNKSEIPRIIEFASLLGFDVKLLDLYMQDQYIATNGIGGKQKFVESSPLEYWNSNYVNLRNLIPEFEKLSEKEEAYNKDGGRGIPMYAYDINGIKVILKDSTRGSFYHQKECIQNCSYFGTTCQEGMYTPHVSSNMVLHVNGCHNSKLRWDLRNRNDQERLTAFSEILELFSNLSFVASPPQPIKSSLNS